MVDSTSLLQRLTGALASVTDLSAPSNTKWRRVDAVLASEFKLPVAKVKTYYASELKQVSVRLTQPGVARDRPVLGMLLVGGEVSVDRYAATLRNYVNAPHPFEAILVGRWNGTQLMLRATLNKYPPLRNGVRKSLICNDLRTSPGTYSALP